MHRLEHISNKEDSELIPAMCRPSQEEFEISLVVPSPQNHSTVHSGPYLQVEWLYTPWGVLPINEDKHT